MLMIFHASASKCVGYAYSLRILLLTAAGYVPWCIRIGVWKLRYLNMKIECLNSLIQIFKFNMQLKETTIARLCYQKSFILSFIETFLFQMFTSPCFLMKTFQPKICLRNFVILSSCLKYAFFKTIFSLSMLIVFLPIKKRA